MNEPDVRDFFAAHASEEDIQCVKHLIQETQQPIKGFDGRTTLQKALPKHWRQIARYIHADLMMDARRERK